MLQVITDTTVEINWDKYGEYVMTVVSPAAVAITCQSARLPTEPSVALPQDAAAKTMTGHTKGKPDDWRKATYLKVRESPTAAHLTSRACARAMCLLATISPADSLRTTRLPPQLSLC